MSILSIAALQTVFTSRLGGGWKGGWIEQRFQFFLAREWTQQLWRPRLLEVNYLAFQISCPLPNVSEWMEPQTLFWGGESGVKELLLLGGSSFCLTFILKQNLLWLRLSWNSLPIKNNDSELLILLPPPLDFWSAGIIDLCHHAQFEEMLGTEPRALCVIDK